MCNIEKLKLWQADNSKLNSETKLGFSIFKRINRGVDALHIKNHVREKCKKDYPLVILKLREQFKNPNTESAEQTFVWLGKFKRILNSMSKRNHHFYLHCLIKERNTYTEWCYKNKLKTKTS